MVLLSDHRTGMSRTGAWHAPAFELRIGQPARRPSTSTRPDPTEEKRLYRVRIIDNPWNTYEEVMRICMIALGCSVEQAYSIAREIDHQGSAIVLEADAGTARHVADTIGTIGIEVRVEPIGVEYS